MSTPLIIAAHGTRDAAGEAECRRLTARVAALLPDTQVRVGFVELSQPSIPQALVEALSPAHAPQPELTRDAVVVPLMLGSGGHVRADIPEFIEQARGELSSVGVRARMHYAEHLGADPRLVAAVTERITAVLGDWQPAETALVFVGRGALVPQANAEHVRLARMHYETGGWSEVQPAFIQVTRPSLPEALERAYAAGARQIVVMGHWLFPGRLRTWTLEQSQHWQSSHTDAQVRVAEVIGDCDQLAAVVVDRYRHATPLDNTPTDNTRTDNTPGHAQDRSPAYLAGLLLADRDVIVVGGGRVATRRIGPLLAAGARVRVISPEIDPSLQPLVVDADTALTWHQRGFTPGDLSGAWYVLAATDDPAVNAQVASEAEAQHTYCVRADDAWGGSAWTPATASARGLTVGVLGNRQPARSRRVRDALLASPALRRVLADELAQADHPQADQVRADQVQFDQVQFDQVEGQP